MGPPTASGLQLPSADAALLVRLLRQAGVDLVRHRPVVFGSRATGRARRYSDVDVGMAGEPLGPAALDRVCEVLEESELPYRVDVVNLADTPESFREVALAGAVALDVDSDGACR